MDANQAVQPVLDALDRMQASLSVKLDQLVDDRSKGRPGRVAFGMCVMGSAAVAVVLTLGMCLALVR